MTENKYASLFIRAMKKARCFSEFQEALPGSVSLKSLLHKLDSGSETPQSVLDDGNHFFWVDSKQGCDYWFRKKAEVLERLDSKKEDVAMRPIQEEAV